MTAEAEDGAGKPGGARVRITGWRPGMQRVSMTRAIREHAGLGLGDAKSRTDHMLDGEEVTLELGDLKAAETLAGMLRDLGAEAVAEPTDG